MYADDHQMYTIGDSIEKAAQEFKEETEKITRSYEENLLKANPSKFQIIVIDPKSSKNECADEVSLEFDSRMVKSSVKLHNHFVNAKDALSRFKDQFWNTMRVAPITGSDVVLWIICYNSTLFPGSLSSASLGRWKKDPGCGWSRDHL